LTTPLSAQQLKEQAGALGFNLVGVTPAAPSPHLLAYLRWLEAGQQAAMGKFLAFSRVQESSADAAGMQYLSKAGISGRGSLSFFRKLESMEFRYGYGHSDEDAFASACACVSCWCAERPETIHSDDQVAPGPQVPVLVRTSS
jgi:hypothetical protein